MSLEFGLIGHPVSHSKSPELYSKFFTQFPDLQLSYSLFELLSIENFPTLLTNHPNLLGLNVTVPHKSAIIPFLHDSSPEVKATHACNTIAIQQSQNNKKIIGFNTDVFGIEAVFHKWNLHSKNCKALILGNGGASKAVQFVCENMNIPSVVVNRNKHHSSQITYDECTYEIIQNHTLIIQTTPVGMYPNTADFLPFGFEAISSQHICFDLIYNPTKTKFLELCESNGAAIENGLFMLQKQAEKSWEIFTTLNPTIFN